MFTNKKAFRIMHLSLKTFFYIQYMYDVFFNTQSKLIFNTSFRPLPLRTSIFNDRFEYYKKWMYILLFKIHWSICVSSSTLSTLPCSAQQIAHRRGGYGFCMCLWV